MKEQFMSAYNDVFTAEGLVKVCGRQKCKELIQICESMDGKSSYGDAEKGFMNIENIKKLYQKTALNQ